MKWNESICEWREKGGNSVEAVGSVETRKGKGAYKSHIREMDRVNDQYINRSGSGELKVSIVSTQHI